MSWKARTRSLVARDGGNWKPCICIQGGGARGAWEAGVLEGLLASRKASPVAIFGTSAGALNAMWAATCQAHSSRNWLLNMWCILARRIQIMASALLATILIGLFLNAYFVGFAVFLAALILSGLCVLARLNLIARVPGLFSIPSISRILPFEDGQAHFHTYVCSADVGVGRLPVGWDADSLCILKMATNEKMVTGVFDNICLDRRTATMTSAALPIFSRPYQAGTKLLLDGGLVANLPVGFIHKYGMLGGHCAICIIPRPLSALNHHDHVDYRVMRLLRDLQVSQQQSRSQRSSNVDVGGGASVVPAHTHIPILVISPSLDLRSGLVSGFFRPGLLRREFDSGYAEAGRVLDAFRCFEAGDDCALDNFLLDNIVLTHITSNVPRPSWWAFWVNAAWRK